MTPLNSEHDLLFWLRFVTNTVRMLAYLALASAFCRYAKGLMPTRSALSAVSFLFMTSVLIAATRVVALVYDGHDWVPYVEIAVTGVTVVAAVRVWGDIGRDPR